MEANYPIDFVITWLDPTDENWIAARREYKPENDEAGGAVRYRDWDLLKYWFRSVEKFAPWVNRIFFVTYGHIPKWLNTDNEKLVIVKHEDFMPSESLPTFNSNAIELCFSMINDLSEHFVYFNDDMFLVDKTSQEDFFVDGLPVDTFAWNCVSAKANNTMIEHIILNDMEILAKHFDKKQVQKKQIGKMLSIRNGSIAIKSFLLFPWKFFVGIENPHVAQPYLKSGLKELWEKEGEALLSTVNNKFRSKDDYSLWLARYWNLVKNNYVLKSRKSMAYFELKDDNSKLFEQIKKNRLKSICINDNDMINDFDAVKKSLFTFFDSLCSEPSSFEMPE